LPNPRAPQPFRTFCRARYELILFLDGCTDGSEAAARNIVREFVSGAWPTCASDDKLTNASESCVSGLDVGPAHVRFVSSCFVSDKNHLFTRQ